MAIKNFQTSVQRAENDDQQPITFSIDGEELTAHPPTSGQLALFMGRVGSHRLTDVAAASALFDFLSSVLDEADYDIVEDKLAEGVDLELITDIVTYLIEEWSARPTERSSASSPSRKSTGTRSTAKRPAKARTTSASR